MTYEKYIAHLDEIASERPLGGICKGIQDAYYENKRLREALKKIATTCTPECDNSFDCTKAFKFAEQALKGE